MILVIYDIGYNCTFLLSHLLVHCTLDRVCITCVPTAEYKVITACSTVIMIAVYDYKKSIVNRSLKILLSWVSLK